MSDLNRRFTLDKTKAWCLAKTNVPDYDLDVAAESLSHLAPRYYSLTERNEDGLILPWDGVHNWCNPPWDNLWAWIGKAWGEWWSFGEGSYTISMLIPVRAEQPFWQQLIEPYRDREGSALTTHFLPKRTEFGNPDDPKKLIKSSPPFTCVLLHWSQK